MAKAKRQLLGEMTAWQIRWVREAVWAEGLPPLDDLNPFAEAVVKSAELERIEAWQAQRRWDAMFGTKKTG